MFATSPELERGRQYNCAVNIKNVTLCRQFPSLPRNAKFSQDYQRRGPPLAGETDFPNDLIQLLTPHPREILRFLFPLFVSLPCAIPDSQPLIVLNPDPSHNIRPLMLCHYYRRSRPQTAGFPCLVRQYIEHQHFVVYWDWPVPGLRTYTGSERTPPPFPKWK
jgi:hypothetical protein